jgi:hypothetical protein
MKTRKSNKLIDKLRTAYEETKDEGKRQHIEELAKHLTDVHTRVIAFLNEQKPKTTAPATPF